MKVLAFNGSPRENSTTAALLNKALEGAASQGAETELVHLNKLTMKGCQSCYSCKIRGGESYGKCVLKDDITPLYQKIEQADALFLGSPIYFGSITGQAKLFMDRLFPYLTYKNYSSLFPKKIPVGLIYTMNADDKISKMYDQHMRINERIFSMLFGSVETLASTDAFHVEDYTKIVGDAVEAVVERKQKHRQEVFPLDCEKAFDMGAKFARVSQ
ncbi:MAG: flavodoxin family protein [Pseudomonadota bacterium]